MPAVSRSPVVTAFWKAHRWVYTKTGGRVGGWLWPGVRVLRLTTTGRRSGEPRDVMLTYLKEGDAYVVAASYAGEPRHPAWYLNLEAKPEATVLVGGRWIPVRARDAAGEERDRLFDRFVETDSAFGVYRERTDRQIPVVVLDPV